MRVQTQRLMIQRIIPEVQMIAGDFEDFCGKLLDHVFKVRLEHSGVNHLGLPVKSVLDSTSDDGVVVVQYSAEQGYFAKGMSKASGDITKALERRPTATRILLISSNLKKPIIADDFKKKVLNEERMKGRSIGVYGAQSIAAWIVRLLLFNDTAIEELSEYLPVLTQIRDEAARNLLFPKKTAQHCARPTVIGEMSTRLNENPCLVLTGIGGCGKSEAVTDFGVENANNYDLKIWLESEDYRDAASLQASPITRGGSNRNIATLLKQQRCLLVIDNPSTWVEQVELSKLCGSGSHILVTVRGSVQNGYPLPMLTELEARMILNRSVDIECPDAIFNAIWATVSGHPLSLSLMNTAIQGDATWEDISLDCRAVGQLAGGEQRLADRLLGNYHQLLKNELSLFEWAGQPDCDIEFLRTAILPAGIRKLKESALTASDRPSKLRLHDVIYQSLSSLDWWSDEQRSCWDDQLKNYLEGASQLNDLRFRTTSINMRNRLHALVAGGDNQPIYILALLEATNPDSDAHLDLDDPAQQAEKISKPGQCADPLQIRSIIETFEWLYLHTKKAGKDKAIAFATDQLQLFDHLEEITNLTARQRSEIKHHRGKALRWTGEHEKARKEFESVLESDEPLDASRLQLIRAYKHAKDNGRVISLGIEIIVRAKKNPGTVSPSILLAVLQDMPWREEGARTNLLWPHQDFITQTIIENATAGVEQAYQTLAAVARFWSKEAPDVLANVLEKNPPTQFIEL